MGTETPLPKRIKLVTKSKDYCLSMEVIFIRFSHLTEKIFGHLDNRGITNFTRVNRQWKNYLNSKRNLQIRKIRSLLVKEELVKTDKLEISWKQFFKASNTKVINHIADSLMK